MPWRNVQFLETGDSYYLALLGAICAARESVLIEKYIFRCDKTGRAILDALIEARARGVRVYIRIDGVGSREDMGALGELGEKGGLELEVFHPLPFASAGAYRPSGFAKMDSFLTRWKMINRRTHRKLVVIDGKTAFTGGRNIDDVESEKQSGRKAWHDLSVKLEGDSVPLLAEAFWLRPFRAMPSRDFLMNYNWRLKLARNSWFHRKLRRASRRIWVVTPYFAPTPGIFFQLRHAARRGVDVRFVLPKKTDVNLSRMAAKALYRALLGRGIRIFEFEPSILHRKLWVIDELALVGSGNLNHRSFIHDLELDVILRSEEQVESASSLFLRDQGLSQEIKLADLERLPIWKRVLYWMASWLVYWL